jgi:hypothetical protein
MADDRTFPDRLRAVLAERARDRSARAAEPIRRLATRQAEPTSAVGTRRADDFARRLRAAVEAGR